MTARQQRPARRRGEPASGVDWGGPRQPAHPDAVDLDQEGATRWGSPGLGARGPQDATDWGGPADAAAPRRGSPWGATARRQRLMGVVFALLGLVLATSAAMNLARSAQAGHPWIPPWLVAALGGAGLVAAAGYLAWAGGTPVRREADRWTPTLVDAAAGLTSGSVEVADPRRLLGAGPAGAGRQDAGQQAAGRQDGGPPRVRVTSGPTPIMGTSTVDPSRHAPAGVAGAVGGFMLAAALVCAVVALVLGPAWLLATAALAVGGITATRLAADWLGVY